jgi:hypothetical protein
LGIVEEQQLFKLQLGKTSVLKMRLLKMHSYLKRKKFVRFVSKAVTTLPAVHRTRPTFGNRLSNKKSETKNRKIHARVQKFP